jgi:deoxyribose-phosphate aldolase
MPEPSAPEIARRLIGLLDLTNLQSHCGPADVRSLCARATAPPVKVAAVCVWPQFVGDCARTLAGSDVRVATVVNFPSGTDDLERVLEDMGEALSDGADEVDLVLPYRAFIAGDEQGCIDLIQAAKDALKHDQKLKVILETGAMPDDTAIERASRLAIDAGADFLKTSTGKVAVSATPRAAGIMLAAIRDSGRPVGLKVSGGIRTLADAAGYLELAERTMGTGWAVPATFRIGASSLHATLVAAADAG